ncbi:MAG: UDPGP type 1 family protein [Sedimentisphaerales bacterium]|nr:UDPGP type 1 family protein [Sedimentisphaerales bacterium]
MVCQNSLSLQAAQEKLDANNQSHLLNFIDQLNPEQTQNLLSQIDALNFDLINPLLDKYVRQEPTLALPQEILPAPVYPIEPTADLVDKYRSALELGESLIRSGKVAAFTVAGGQGTRLNFNGPKGNFPATPIKQKTLFQVFAEGIAAVQNAYGAVIPWYIMTSPANHADTVAAFQANNYFGLDPANVMHFPQGMMPSFHRDGKIVLASPDSLALSPDGHGGSLRALHTSGALEDMSRRGIEQISYFQIDNPLVYVIDPMFIGLHALDQAEMSSKAVIKAEPLEKVGNFTLVDGRVTVIEYSDLPDKLAQKRNPDGSLCFESGSIAIHVIKRDFVAQLNQHGFSLPWHRAVKRVPYIDSNGALVEPDQPNAVKLETFVFDALPLAQRSIIYEIDRKEQFAPIKNATGTDSVESSQQLQIERAAAWLERAGITVPRKPDGAVDAQIEISPLFAHCPEALTEKASSIKPINPGDCVYIA